LCFESAILLAKERDYITLLALEPSEAARQAASVTEAPGKSTPMRRASRTLPRRSQH
jgi:hypothetical protein